MEKMLCLIQIYQLGNPYPRNLPSGVLEGDLVYISKTAYLELITTPRVQTIKI